MPNLLRNQRGQGMVEYILIVVFVVVAGIAVWKAFGKTIREKVTDTSTHIDGIDVGGIAKGK